MTQTALNSPRISVRRAARRRGFTLLELAIVLAISGLLFGGLWSLLSGSNQQLEDPGIAQQHLQLTEAVRGFMTSSCAQAVAFRATLTAGGAAGAINIADLTTCGLLPTGFVLTNTYGQGFEARARDLGSSRYEFMVVNSAAGTPIPNLRGARIAALMGADGGFIADDATDINALGAFGAWQVANITAAPWSYVGTRPGRLASYSITGTDTAASPWLARNASLGTTYNTMSTNLTMAANTDIVMSGTGDITMNDATITDAGLIDLVIFRGTPAEINTTIAPGDLTLTNNTATVLTLNSGFDPAMDINGIGVADTFRAASFIYTSDARLKQNVAPLENALGRVLALQGVSFVWKDTGVPGMGFVAQDVQKVFPAAVHTQADGTLGVEYGNLLAPTVEAVRALHEENKQLKKRLDALEEKLK